MLLHNRVFFIVQPPRLLKNFVLDADFADIVQHGGHAENIFVIINLLLLKAALFRPRLIDFRRIRADAVDVRAGFFRVAQLRHADHPQNDRPRHLRPLNRHRRVNRKHADERNILLRKRRNHAPLIFRVNQLHHADDLVLVIFQRQRQHRTRQIMRAQIVRRIERIRHVFLRKQIHVGNVQRLARAGDVTGD